MRTKTRVLFDVVLSLGLLVGSTGLGVSSAAAAGDGRGPAGSGAPGPVVVTAPFVDCESVVGIPPSECAALVDLYTSTNGPGWSIRSGWLQNNTPCEWFGITCVPGHVHVVNLIGNGLTGPLPASLPNLTFLQFLFVDHNSLTGPLPSWLPQLTFLISVELDSNQLSGPLLPELSTLPLLVNLDLDDNFFTGSIPPEWGSFSNLRTLDLDNNLLSGPLPATLGNLSKLALLDVHGNQFTGSIPPALGNATSLATLDLSENQFTGGVPAELGNLTKLASLNLANNQLSGALPAALQNLSTVSSLAFQNTGLCEPASAPFQAWLNGISFVISTEVVCPVGGRNLHIGTGALDLTWDSGEGQSGYVLFRYNTATTAGDLMNLPANALDYAESEPDGALYCYLLAAMDGPLVLGTSDLLCAQAGQATGPILPGAFTLTLNQSATTTLRWTTPAGGVDSYQLVVLPLSGAPPVMLPLGPALVTTTHATGGTPTCYMLIALRGAEGGVTNVLCGMPGFSSLSGARQAASSAALQAAVSSALGMLRMPVNGYSDLRTAFGRW